MNAYQMKLSLWPSQSNRLLLGPVFYLFNLGVRFLLRCVMVPVVIESS